MADNSENIEARLCAYVEGDLDESDRAEIERHLEANPKHRHLLRELAATRSLLRYLPRESAPSELAESFNGQLERSVLLDSPGIDRAAGAASLHANFLPRLLALAAVVILAVLLGVITFVALPRGDGGGGSPLALPGTTMPAGDGGRGLMDRSPTDATGAPGDDAAGSRRIPGGATARDGAESREAELEKSDATGTRRAEALREGLMDNLQSEPHEEGLAAGAGGAGGAHREAKGGGPEKFGSGFGGNGLAGAGSDASGGAEAVYLVVSAADLSAAVREVESNLRSQQVEWEDTQVPARQVEQQLRQNQARLGGQRGRTFARLQLENANARKRNAGEQLRFQQRAAAADAPAGPPRDTRKLESEEPRQGKGAGPKASRAAGAARGARPRQQQAGKESAAPLPAPLAAGAERTAPESSAPGSSARGENGAEQGVERAGDDAGAAPPDDDMDGLPAGSGEQEEVAPQTQFAGAAHDGSEGEALQQDTEFAYDDDEAAQEGGTLERDLHCFVAYDMTPQQALALGEALARGGRQQVQVIADQPELLSLNRTFQLQAAAVPDERPDARQGVDGAIEQEDATQPLDAAAERAEMPASEPMSEEAATEPDAAAAPDAKAEPEAGAAPEAEAAPPAPGAPASRARIARGAARNPGAAPKAAKADAERGGATRPSRAAEPGTNRPNHPKAGMAQKSMRQGRPQPLSARIVAGERLTVTVDELAGPETDKTIDAVVARDGTIALTNIKPVRVLGLTRAQAEQAIARAYRDAEVVDAPTVTVERAQADPAAMEDEAPAEPALAKRAGRSAARPDVEAAGAAAPPAPLEESPAPAPPAEAPADPGVPMPPAATDGPPAAADADAPSTDAPSTDAALAEAPPRGQRVNVIILVQRNAPAEAGDSPALNEAASPAPDDVPAAGDSSSAPSAAGDAAENASGAGTGEAADNAEAGPPEDPFPGQSSGEPAPAPTIDTPAAEPE